MDGISNAQWENVQWPTDGAPFISRSCGGLVGSLLRGGAERADYGSHVAHEPAMPIGHHRPRAFAVLLVASVILAACGRSRPPVIDRDAVFARYHWWDNRDWNWYEANIPFFEAPDTLIEATYYYRWEVVTKHLTYGSPETGYVFTEFLDRPFWSGTYGAISCPLGHQFYEARWLRDRRSSTC